MDISSTQATTTTPPTPTQTTNTPNTKSPEQESETPTRIQNAKPLSFTNGVLKRHHHPHHHHHHHLHPPVVFTYKECLKNHAANLGHHALDGCGEFMPSPTATPTDPTSLKCAACGCHRNFHRKEPEDMVIPPPTPNTTTTIEYQPHHRHHPPPPPPHQAHRSPNSASPPPISSAYYPSAPHMLLALSGNLQAPPPDNNTNAITNISVSPSALNPSPSARKRFRTKFTQHQKDRMLEFAERVGWKMQKRDEELVHEFCNEVGVEKGVLKVWMHNNKNTFGKRDLNGNGITGIDNNDLVNHENKNSNKGDHNEDESNNNNGQNMDHFESDGVAHVGTNGSSSSS